MQVIFNIFIATSIYMLIGYSFSIMYSSSKFFNLAQAITITISGYFTFSILQQINFSLGFAMILAVILSILLGNLFETFVYKPLRKKNNSPLIMLLASLGLYIVLQNCISILWGDDTKNIRIGEIKVGNELLGAYITSVQIITIFVSITLFISSLIFLKHTKIGRNIQAVSSNIELANIMGINSDKIILWTFSLSSGMAAIAGILVALDTGLTPIMGFNLLLYGVVAMIIGGVGSTWGLIGGALLLATTQHLTSYYIDSKWMDAITYVILILFLIWKPLGFSGSRLKKNEI
jgi:branched-chain amino acid transport system permease protein